MEYLIIPALVLIASCIRIINQYERGVVFTLGKFTSLRQPGLNFVVPLIQSMDKVDIRIKAESVPDQNAITRDNVTVNVNAVLYYKIIDGWKEFEPNQKSESLLLRRCCKEEKL